MSWSTELLKKDKLKTSKCLLCKNLIWPPAGICPKCLSNNIKLTTVSSYGKLIEFSESFIEKKPAIFGIVKMNERICLMGRIICHNDIEIREGMNVKLVKIEMRNIKYYYEFLPI